MHKHGRTGRFVSIPVKDRFWDKVNKNGPMHPYDESLGRCWPWMGRNSGKAGFYYGRIKNNGRQLSAHRVAWELVNGKIPRGKRILHTCDNPSCVNPGHTYPGTDADNHRDMIMRGRMPNGERHPRATISDKLAAAIRRDFPQRPGRHGTRYGKEKVALEKFLRAYKISYRTAWGIATGRTRKHLSYSPPVPEQKHLDA